MPQPQTAEAWWADVAEVRERIEARRAAPAAPRALRAVRAEPLPGADPAAAPRPQRRTVRINGRGAQPPAVRPLVAAPPRRPSRRPAEQAAHRPDRMAGWAVLLGVLLVLVAVASAHAAPRPAGPTASAAATSLGDRSLHVPMRGRDVRQLQRHLRRMHLLRVRPTARFGPLTRAAVRRYQRLHCLAADGVAGPATIAAIRRRAARCAPHRRGGSGTGTARGLRRRVVTWYGPGLYGRRTACGQRLTSRLLGVAHRTLPCGTRVRFRYRGHSVVARVVDRGPYAEGVHYDLTWAAAGRLRVIAAGRVTLRASR